MFLYYSKLCTINFRSYACTSCMHLHTRPCSWVIPLHAFTFSCLQHAFSLFMHERACKPANLHACFMQHARRAGKIPACKACVHSLEGTDKVQNCGGHVWQAHMNNLTEAAKNKEFLRHAEKFKNKFPYIKTLKCKCGWHKSVCECLAETFTTGAGINHFCILQQWNSPEDYVERIYECCFPVPLQTHSYLG